MITAAGLIVAGSALAQGDAATTTVDFTNLQGESIGTAKLTGTRAGLLIGLDLRGLPPGWHGFHVHETGECDAEGGFKSAGGHYAVSDTEHGFLSEHGPHSGDMPNQYVGEDGTLRAQVLDTYVFLGGDTGNASGKALIIHAGADDYESQPSGDAGDRLACGVIE
ncbi:superoxide dismutase family protein [Amaricoccus solimangrovi]|uniref:Superoxide dismutase [Cu-Zn] n=2 Tax=Amaricoccus solimangrovi TaxID=2589815 RepID=A0A501WSF2_9RHOB|nr:superoxide dismutase family protein [Amaricoccus solimangrovi]